MIVLGIDEVGRGSLAGPLVIGAVVLNSPIPGLKDSKLLSPNNRKILAKQIYKASLYAGLGWVSSTEIDSIGLSNSLILAANRSIKNIYFKVDKIIIDGSVNFLKELNNSENLIRADVTIAAVSAASIIAKVARDQFMQNLSKDYPKYFFHQNVGYGTSDHITAINKYGPCAIHRRSFEPVKSLLVKNYST